MDLKEKIRSKIPKEELEYGAWYVDYCIRCKRQTNHYGDEFLYLYCSECGFVTSDDLDEEVEQLDLE